MNVVDSGTRVPDHLAVVVWVPLELCNVEGSITGRFSSTKSNMTSVGGSITQDEIIEMLMPYVQKLLPWQHYGVFEDEDDELVFEFEALGGSAIGRTLYCGPKLSLHDNSSTQSIGSGMKELPRR